MIKTFLVITISGLFVAPVGVSTTLVNAGNTHITVVDATTKEALQALDESQQKAVCRSLYSVAPGASLKLSAGTYHIDLGEGFANSVIVQTEKKATVTPPAAPVIPEQQSSPAAPVVPPIEPPAA